MILPTKYARNIGVTLDSVLNFEHIILTFESLLILILVNYRVRKFLSTKREKILVNAFKHLQNSNLAPNKIGGG